MVSEGVRGARALVVAILVLAASLGSLAYLAGHPSTSALAEPVTYAREKVQLPVNGTGGTWWGPWTNLTFDGVGFALFPCNGINPNNGSFYGPVLTGDGREASGIHLAFTLRVSAGSGFFAPDGIWGVVLESWAPGLAMVDLIVSEPMVVYAEENVTLGWSPNTPYTFSFRGVTFNLELRGTFGGTELNASAVVPCAGLVSSCISYTLTVGVPGSAGLGMTLESSSPHHLVGLYWDLTGNGHNVTLMVRIA